MTEINIDPMSPGESYPGGFSGEHGNARLLLDMTELQSSEVSFYQLRFESPLGDVFLSKQFKNEDINDGVLSVDLWRDVTSYDQCRFTVECIKEDESGISLIAKSALVTLTFEPAVMGEGEDIDDLVGGDEESAVDTVKSICKEEIDSACAKLDDKIGLKQNALTAGDNITIDGDVISATCGGGGTADYDDLENQIHESTNIIKTEVIGGESTLDSITDRTSSGPLSYTNSVGGVFSEDTIVLETSIMCSSGSVKFAVYSVEKAYPQAPTDSRQKFTKVRELGTATVENNIATLDLRDNPATLHKDEIILAGAENKLLHYQRTTGAADNEAYIYYLNSYQQNIGDTVIDVTLDKETISPRPLYKLTISQGSEIIEHVTPLKDIVSENATKIDALEKEVTSISSSDTGLEERNTRIFSNRISNINKYFVLIVDDVTRGALTIADKLIENDIYPAFGLKMESMGIEITWEEVRKLQSLGFEIFFHGMAHTHTPAGTAPNNDDIMAEDIKEFKALCKANGVVINGYGGPNHYPLPVSCFREFEWARTAYGLKSYGGGGSAYMSDTFANAIVMSTEITSDTQDIGTFKGWSASVLDNQYLTPMCHTQNLVAHIDKYIELFNAWKSDDLECIRPCDAVKQSLWDSGSIGQNSTFEIQAGTATAPYFVVAKNGNVKTNVFEVSGL